MDHQRHTRAGQRLAMFCIGCELPVAVDDPHGCTTLSMGGRLFGVLCDRCGDEYRVSPPFQEAISRCCLTGCTLPEATAAFARKGWPSPVAMVEARQRCIH